MTRQPAKLHEITEILGDIEAAFERAEQLNA